MPPPHAPPEEGGVGVLVQYGLQLPQSEGRLCGAKERERERDQERDQEIKREIKRVRSRERSREIKRERKDGRQ